MRPVPSSEEGTKALINAATISSCPLYMISCAVLLHFSKKEKKIRNMQKDTLEKLKHNSNKFLHN